MNSTFSVIVLIVLILFFISIFIKVIYRFFMAMNKKNERTPNIQKKPEVDPLLAPMPKTDLLEDQKPLTQRNVLREFIRLNIIPIKKENFVWSELIKIFRKHRLIQTEKGFFIYKDKRNNLLYRIVSMTEPGYFPVKENQAGEHYQTKGISLFMLNNSNNQRNITLNKMIEMADSLADDLKGKVLDENLQVLTEEKVQQYFEPVFTS